MLLTTGAFLVTVVPFAKGINEFIFKASLDFWYKRGKCVLHNFITKS